MVLVASERASGEGSWGVVGSGEYYRYKAFSIEIVAGTCGSHDGSQGAGCGGGEKRTVQKSFMLGCE